MNKTETKNDVKVAFPSREEMKTAQLICCGRCCTQCETPAEYAWRKREVDMANLLELAIKNELTETEREAVRLYWYESETVTSIADKKGINPSAVNRTLSRAKEKLENVLKYAVLYQNELYNEDAVPVILGRARVIAAAKMTVGVTTGERISKLRQSQNLTRERLASALGMGVKRLENLENNVMPDGNELLSLSVFFNVSSDYILKGESDEQ